VKISCGRQTLLSELQVIARAAATRGAIQALSGVRLTTTDGGIELAATDTELALRSSIEAEVKRPGVVLLPARLLVDILRALGGETVSLEQRAEAGEVTVASERANFSLRTLLADDFPRIPEAPDGGAVELPAKAVAETIDRVAKAASRDETRPVLTGILVSVDGDGLRMVATDSYRLSVKETPLEDGDREAFKANVPARALQELGRIATETSAETISIAAQDNQIVFGVERMTLSSRLIDGQFPNYQQLLPDTYEHEVRVSRDELLAVVRRVSILAQRTAPLRLKFDSGELTLSAQTPDVGEASETMPVAYDGETLEIGFNPQFLQDGLDSVEADDLVIKLISPLRPGLLEAAGEDDGDGKFLYLIMPVRLNV
jgi:DNA polymerase III subunit beta